jgi:hypothetical protein
MLDRDLGVLHRRYAFEDRRDVEALFDPLDIAPVELSLIDASVVVDAPPAALVAFGVTAGRAGHRRDAAVCGEAPPHTSVGLWMTDLRHQRSDSFCSSHRE